MKILIAGAGSIGKRHANNGAALGHEIIICDTDPAKGIAFDAGIAQKPDAVIIATPHITHIELARRAIDSGAHVLIEKPIAISENGISELIAAAADKNKKLFVVCNMRFHPAIQAIKNNIHRLGKIHFARAQYGEYLPTMRAGIDYRTVYSAKKALGGGIIFDVIHEIDYLSWLMGPVESLTCEIDRRADFETDVEDYAALLLRHQNGVRSEIHMDYLQQFKQRGCDIVGENGSILWHSTGKNPEHISVKLYPAQNNNIPETLYESSTNDPNAAYVTMLKQFINAIEGATVPDLLTAPEAWHELKTALAAYSSAKEGYKILIRKNQDV